jgi:hypothetical protein
VSLVDDILERWREEVMVRIRGIPVTYMNVSVMPPPPLRERKSSID